MILIIDEFDNPHQTTELDDDVVMAINDGTYTAYHFNSNKIQKYDGNNWVDIEKWPS